MVGAPICAGQKLKQGIGLHAVLGGCVKHRKKVADILYAIQACLRFVVPDTSVVILAEFLGVQGGHVMLDIRHADLFELPR